MKVKAASGIMLTLLLISMLTLAFNIQPVEASGTIYIRADGSVDPPTAPIQRDGDIYTFTDNITEPIVVQRSNIIIDGNGYTLQGSGSEDGFRLLGINNVTIKKTNIKGFNNGIDILVSFYNTISDNNITNNAYGIDLNTAHNTTFSGNNIINNGRNVLYGSNNTISENNIVNNGPVDIGGSGNNIVGNNITDNSMWGVRLLGSYNSFFGNIIANNEGYGVYLFESSFNKISRNNITNNNNYGVYLIRPSNNNTISDNNITNNSGGIGIEASYGPSGNHTISRNTIAYNKGNGISLFPWDVNYNDAIFGNIIANNEGYGIYLYHSSFSTVFDNIITNNNYGIFLSSSSNNVLKNNSMVGNRHGFGVFDSYVQDVDTSNTIDGKPVRYLFNQKSLMINLSTFPDIGYLALINSYNITVEGLELKNNGQGVLFANTTNSQILNNNIANNSYGVYLAESSYNTLYGNNITNSDYVGIYLPWFPGNNTIFHNNFMNNTEQVRGGDEYTNTWDIGYRYGGNYWSDYTGVDAKSGPAQDQLGSDGIGDTPYVLTPNNIDHYPLMSPWPSEPSTHELQVTLKAPTRLLPGDSTLLEATVSNYGLINETNVDLFLLINNTIVNSTTISFLEVGSSYTINYLWTPPIEGWFNVTTYAPPLLEEIHVENNRKTIFVNERTPVHNINTQLNYFTIQEAIDATETLEGHTIEVEVGIYYENVMVNKNNLTLVGENPSITIIDGNGTGNVVDIYANSVYVNNFTVQNGSNGIYIHMSSYNTISGNIITNNTLYGVYSASSSNNVFRNNSFVHNKYNFYVEGVAPTSYIHDVDESNLVDGKPMYYWVNRQNMRVPSDAGYVALVNCYNITAEGLKLENQPSGVLLVSTENSLIMNNNITNNDAGIQLYWSSYNNLSGNNITNNLRGVNVFNSSNNNIIFRNYITNNNGTGISVEGYNSGSPKYYVWYSSNNVISENNITDNAGKGVWLELASSNIISRNNITNNEGTGVYIYGYWSGWPDFIKLYSSNNIVSENNITSNGSGVSLVLASSNTISENIITNSTENGLTLARAYGNTILGNDITNNGRFGVQIATLCSGNIISGNNISNNTEVGVLLHDGASSNTISGNNISNNIDGIKLGGTSNNIISGNNITDNSEKGIWLSYSISNNKIYHNNFINNGENGWVEPGGQENIWHDGYPSGGNYWSNYTGTDVKSGPNQDQPGSDGIGDTPYVLTGNNIDRYPLMSPWPSGPGLHEIEVNLNAPTYLPPGNSTILQATVSNKGLAKEENVTLFLHVNNTVVNSTTISFLEVGSSYTINYLWTPTVEGLVNVTAYAAPVPGEILVENNRKTAFVTVSINPPVQNINTGLYYETIQEAIDASETLDGHTITVKPGTYYEHVTISKSLKIIGEDRTNTIIDGSKTGTWVVRITANNVVLSGFTVQNSNAAPTPAIRLDSSNNIISNNTIINNGWGIYAFGVSNNTIENNIITNNVYGVYLEWVTTHTVKNNTIADHQQAGIYLRESRNNIFTNNVIESNKEGIVLISDSNNNKFYHNNFIDNTSPGFAVNSDNNSWDNDYPSGGNYWSDYSGDDFYSGPYQNETGSDGIGDTPYTYWPDGYPLMNSMGSPQLPIAIFTYAPEYPVVDETATFNATSSCDRDGSIISYQWNFGDGNSDTGVAVTHAYLAEGTYTVTLNVTDDDGLTHIATANITVSPPPVHDIAVTSVTAPTEAIVGEIVPISVEVANQGTVNETFDVTVSYDTTVIGTQTINLPAGDSATVDFDWNTTELTADEYIINVTVPVDDDLNNNFKTTTIKLKQVVFPVTVDGLEFNVVVESNSTVSNFDFRKDQKEISFNVTGPDGTAGFCNVTIPMALMKSEPQPWLILIDGEVVTDIFQSDNGTHTFLYFTYTHTTRNIIIRGTWVVPEFSSVTIIALFMLLALVLVALTKKRRTSYMKQK